MPSISAYSTCLDFLEKILVLRGCAFNARTIEFSVMINLTISFVLGVSLEIPSLNRHKLDSCY